MDNDKHPFLIKHRDEIRKSKKMNVIVMLRQQTVDDLADDRRNIQTRAKNYICSRFNEAVKEKYGEDIVVKFDELLPPDSEVPSQPHSSQVRSPYHK